MKFYFLFFSFFIGCYNLQEPNWITKYPKAQDYWFGIGSIEKPFSGSDIREAARTQAFNEIASQISINLESSFEKVVTEHNLELDRFAKSIITTQVQNSLSSIEVIETFESKNRYYILARLSKDSYYEEIDKKRRNAVVTSLSLIKEAEADFSVHSFNLLSQAMNEVSPYLNYSIQAEYPEGSGDLINLYSYIKILTNKYMDRIQLRPSKEVIEYKYGLNKAYEIELKVIDLNKSTPISNMPISCFLDKSEKRPFSRSDSNGLCIFSIPEIQSNRSIYYINYEVDLKQLFELSDAFGSIKSVQSQSTLKIIPPKISLITSEKNLGNIVANSYVEPVIINFFLNSFSAEFVDSEDVDLIINVVINTHSVSDNANEYGIFQVFGDITISIINARNGSEIMQKSFNKIQGSDFNSNKEAANQALQKISKIISNDFLPEIINSIKIN